MTYGEVMKRMYWTNPDVFETEVEVKAFDDCKVTIDPIIFHPDEGGQPADKGTIGQANVCNVEIINGQIIHTLDSPLGDGKYIARVDRQHRFYTASQHTAQHIVSGIADERFEGDLFVEMGWGYSEYTPMESDTLKVGDHDLIEILRRYEGKEITLFAFNEPSNILDDSEWREVKAEEENSNNSQQTNGASS